MDFSFSLMYISHLALISSNVHICSSLHIRSLLISSFRCQCEDKTWWKGRSWEKQRYESLILPELPETACVLGSNCIVEVVNIMFQGFHLVCLVQIKMVNVQIQGEL